MAENNQATAAQIQQVQPRVGLTARARLQWALDFTQRDFKSLTLGDLANLQLEFLAFRDFLISPDMVNDPRIPALLADHVRLKSKENPPPPPRGATLETIRWVKVDPRPLPTKTALRRAQSLWREMILPLLEPNGMMTRVRYFRVSVDIQRLDQIGRSHMSLKAEQDPSAQLHVATLLGAYAHLVHVCPESVCRRWFVATRRGQVYCGRTCQNRATIREYRAAAQAETSERPPRRRKASRP